MKLRFFISVLFLLVCFMSCHNIKKENILQMADNWTGKIMIFPESMTYTVQGEKIPNDSMFNTEYTIVSYVDTIGCLSCKLHLDKWKIIIQEMNGITPSLVSPILIFHVNDMKEATYMLDRYEFNYPICIDTLDIFNKVNHLPSIPSFQTFLLDKDNKIVAIGNPVYNPKIKELYMNIIQGKADLN